VQNITGRLHSSNEVSVQFNFVLWEDIIIIDKSVRYKFIKITKQANTLLKNVDLLETDFTNQRKTQLVICNKKANSYLSLLKTHSMAS